MTFREAFVAASARLAAAGSTDSPDLDARVLLGHCAGLSHAALLARWSDPVVDETADAFAASLLRRLDGEPVAWITGFKEFLGMDFEVGPGLLVPRADTETLVEAALEVHAGPRVVDVGTGTGCVAIALAATSQAHLEVWAGDLSPVAVETARRNAARLLPAPQRVTVVRSDLLEALPGPWELIVSNPPYLTPDETRARVEQGWREPPLALDGKGRDGLDVVRKLVGQATRALAPGGWVLIEAADAQMEAIGKLYSDASLVDQKVWKDLAGQRRVAGARRQNPPQ